jgi:hypothetical protein
MRGSLKGRQPATVEYILDRAVHVTGRREQSAYVLGGVGKTHVLELLQEKVRVKLSIL